MDYKKIMIDLVEIMEIDLGFYEAGMTVDSAFDEGVQAGCSGELKKLLLFIYRQTSDLEEDE